MQLPSTMKFCSELSNDESTNAMDLLALTYCKLYSPRYLTVVGCWSGTSRNENTDTLEPRKNSNNMKSWWRDLTNSDSNLKLHIAVHALPKIEVLFHLHPSPKGYSMVYCSGSLLFSSHIGCWYEPQLYHPSVDFWQTWKVDTKSTCLKHWTWFI